GKSDLLWEHGQERAFGESAVADFSAPRTAQELRLARAEGREVVVQHELLVVLADQRVDLLLVGGGAERRHDERLRLTPSEQRRTVRARKHLHLAADRANVGEAAAVESPAIANDGLAHDVLLELVDQLSHGLAPDGVVAADGGRRRVGRLVERRVALLLD